MTRVFNNIDAKNKEKSELENWPIHFKFRWPKPCSSKTRLSRCVTLYSSLWLFPPQPLIFKVALALDKRSNFLKQKNVLNWKIVNFVFVVKSVCEHLKIKTLALKKLRNSINNEFLNFHSFSMIFLSIQKMCATLQSSKK